METELWLSGIYFPRFSARGCVQELWPVVDDRLFQRTINGKLLFLGQEKNLKYRTIITCQDHAFPMLGHIGKGATLDVGCLQTMSQPLLSSKATLCRPCIDGSISVFGKDHEGVPFHVNAQGQETEVVSEEGLYVKFRPILRMRITDFRLTHHEWGEKNGWTITLEEV